MADNDVPLQPEHGIVVSADSKVSQEAIDRAVESVRALAGWHVWPERTDTLSVLVPGDGQVILPTKRLVDVVSLSVDGVAVDIGSLVWDESGTIYVPSLKPRCDGVPRRVVAEIRHGFSNPSDLIGVVWAIAARASQPQQQYSVGRISVGAPGSATPQSTEWRILDVYKLGARP